jgi:hypothetical protein
MRAVMGVVVVMMMMMGAMRSIGEADTCEEQHRDPNSNDLGHNSNRSSLMNISGPEHSLAVP